MGYELAKAVRSRVAAICCFGVVVLAFVLPKGGLGLPLCQFKVLTGLPCLGCGLTRSFIGMAHLNIADALFYHPFGVVLFPLALFLAVMGIVPERTRGRVAGWAELHDRRLTRSGWGLLIAMGVYGLARIGWVMTNPGQPSPW